MKISISAASRLTGKHRSTISKAAGDLKSFPGPKGAWLYESRELLQRLYIGSDGAPTASEALRLLSLARTEQVKLQNAKLSGDSFTREVVVSCSAETIACFRGSLFALKGRTVTDQDIDHISDEMREFSIAFLPEDKRPAARRELCYQALDETAAHVQYMREGLRKDAWHARCEDALANLRAAYNRSLADKTDSALAALEQARATVRSAAESEPGRPAN